MQPSDLKQRLYDQLALDYCCTPAEAVDRKNQFHVYVPLEGRRRFEEKPVTFLKVVSFRNKLMFTGDERIVAWCRSMYENDEGSWFMEPGNMRVLDRKLEEYGYCLDKIHPFFVPKDEVLESTAGNSCVTQREHDFDFRLYQGTEIEAFRGDSRFKNAYSFCETAPDIIGVAAFRGDDILGMAGASADSAMFWQIGIDVLPEARGLGIGKILVTRLRDEILKHDRVPYYGTATSHMLSQNVAIASGFRPAWAELTTRQLQD